VPVIFVSARGEEMDRILGLELGADDYLTKPFSPRELVARIRAILRRTLFPLQTGEIIEVGNIKINTYHRRITIVNNEIQLTPKEYQMLLMFIQHPCRNFNRQELLDRIWGYDYMGDIRAVDELVKRLRKKLRDYQSEKNIKTIWGYGYRFD
jgi:DNA-binding response OmpR family regulator